jgi:hypothetical protein
MLVHLLDMGIEYIATRLEQVAKDALSPIAPYLRKLAIGTVLVLVSTAGFIMGLCGAMVALFLLIADLPYADAAGWCALASFGVSLLLTLSGASMIRPPR